MYEKYRALTDEDYIEIGQRFGSDDVAAEAALTIARWGEDLVVLSRYGYGNASFDAFKGLVAEHRSIRTARPDAVASKLSALRNRDLSIEAGWEWVDQTSCALAFPAGSKRDMAATLNTAFPKKQL